MLRQQVDASAIMARLPPGLLARPETQRALTPRMTKYIPLTPTAKQQAFLLLDDLEAFYGGAAGGGKSVGLLMAALQYVDVPGYRALLLRRTYTDLALPEALMDVAFQWLRPTDARWLGSNKTWVFPSGATLSFGYLELEKDKYRYKSAAFQYIGFDELTQFSLSQYTFLFSRLRRQAGFAVPLRMRSASNPGDVGHEWVESRFQIVRFQERGVPPPAGRVYIPARLDDNPHLDREEYMRALNELDPVTREQLLRGDWTARQAGDKFRREWFEVLPQAPRQLRKRVRYWDMAATEAKRGKDPDWTVGLLLGVDKSGVYYVCDVRRTRSTPLRVEKLIRQTAELDGVDVPIYMEQEPGASGKQVIDHYRRNVLAGFTFRGDLPSGDKEVRANPVSSMAEGQNIKLVAGAWNAAFLAELEAFPQGAHDDQVDALSGAFAVLAGRRKLKLAFR